MGCDSHQVNWFLEHHFTDIMPAIWIESQLKVSSSRVTLEILETIMIVRESKCIFHKFLGCYSTACENQMICQHQAA